MLRTVTILLLSGLVACNASWKVQDLDGDGYSPLDGDCWDSVEGPDGSELGGIDIHPSAADLWYDGVDQDCAGDDDYDQDGDGYVPDAFVGMATSNVDGSGELPGGDCWDDPTSIPDEQRVVSSSFTDSQGTSLSWEQPSAVSTNPDGIDVWYDGADTNCDGLSDFDRDNDGFATDNYPDQAGSFGDDCIDGSDLDDDNPAGSPAGMVNPDADERFYDGTDQDCDGNDCDADGDGYDADPWDEGFCANDDCADDNADLFPDPSIPEVWYNGVDENCDNNDGDQDDDGYWVLGYEQLVEAAGGTPLPIPSGFEDDCDDTLASTFPGATDTWYDGVDSNCEGDDDYDQDVDGFRSDAFGGTDCDDGAADVNPDAMETWYDGVDANCDGASDYDQDLDGHDADAYGGTDCDDTDAGINPDASETWYDGVDSDCAGDSDYDQDADGFDSDAHGGTDCDDVAASVNPSATEIWYDGVDGDCSGGSDYDQDADGYDSDDHGGTDCNDTSTAYNPGVAETWYDGLDQNCDGLSDFDQDGDGYNSDSYGGTDCDDLEATIHRNATETWYDGVDSDCSGGSDYDQDADGYDSDAYGGTDCDDLVATTNPGATEVWYDGVDADCSGGSDFDQDGDSYDSEVHGGTDCDDLVATTNPGATEVWYDGVDADCSGGSDYDQDGDGYASAEYIGIDCDDLDAAINPGATEVWYDGVDSDCSGGSDYDQDADGYDSDAHGGADCADTSASINPGATEVWYDGVDSDCSGGSDYDQDADGYDSDAHGGADCADTSASINPGATEVWYDGVDSDCSGGSDYDQDGDGYASAEYIGIDCDDYEAGVNPGVASDDATTLNMIDDDCDGWIDEDGVGSGSLIFTEVSRISTADTHSTHYRDDNWVEIYNTEAFDIALDDVAFRGCDEAGTGVGGGFPGDVPDWGACDGETWFALSPDAALVVPAGDYVTICFDDSYFNGTGHCDYAWGDTASWTGSNPDGYAYSVDDTLYRDQNGMVGVYYAGVITDSVGWYYRSGTTWPYTSKRTMTLSVNHHTAALNDDATNWCSASNSAGYKWSTSYENNYGSPGYSDIGCAK
jgi:hypothetical protein